MLARQVGSIHSMVPHPYEENTQQSINGKQNIYNKRVITWNAQTKSTNLKVKMRLQINNRSLTI